MLARAGEVAEGKPGLAAFYALEKDVEYTCHWQDAQEHLLAAWTRLGTRDDWHAALLAPPPDLNLLIDSFDRSRRSVDWAGEESAWSAKGPDRMYARSRPTSISHAFAAHLHLLFALDPTTAVDYFAELPSGGLAWAGAAITAPWKDIGLVEELVSRAGESGCNLALAGLFNAIESQCRKNVAARDTAPFTIANDEHERAVEEEIQDFAPSWLKPICRAALARGDAPSVVGPWLRYLVSTVDGTPAHRNHHPLLASLSLSELERALPRMAEPLEVRPLDRTSAKCVLARMFSRQAQGQECTDLWHEWIDVLLDENASLFHCGQFAWNFAAASLAEANSPPTDWLSSLAKLQPLFRQYARAPAHRPTASNLFLPAAIAAALRQDQALWQKVYEQVRRYALVCSPLPSHHLEYQLPALVAQVYPQVFKMSAVSEDILDLLPTVEHRQWALAGKKDSPPEREKGERQGSDLPQEQ